MTGNRATASTLGRARVPWAVALPLTLALALLFGPAVVPVPGVTGVARADAVRSAEYWLGEYGFLDAWKVSRGQGVKVAVIDTGVDGSHPDLSGVVVAGRDFSGQGAADGSRGIGSAPEHGTLVATSLAGRGHGADGQDGILGTAPEASILAASVWLSDNEPAGMPDPDDQVAQAVRWAVDSGARVINMSLGSSSVDWPTSWDDAFSYAEAHDVVVVAAAGNRASGSNQVGAPATIPGVLAVGGVDRNGKASLDASTQGITIGVAAPSEELVGGTPGGGYAQWAGTSGAAPLVSGLAALIRSHWPAMSAADVVNRIIRSARPATAQVPDPNYGYGAIDARAALTADIPAVSANPLGSIADWIRMHRRGAGAQAPNRVTLPAPAPSPAPTATARRPDAVAAPPAGPRWPGLVLAGYAVLVVAVGSAGAASVHRIRRRSRGTTTDSPAAPNR